jgi:hypothetical protein
METAEIGTYVMVALTIGLIVFIWFQRQRNIEKNKDEPKIAGEDTLGGSAINPEYFDEPDDDALDEMHDLLEKAAEAQGLTYEE